MSEHWKPIPGYVNSYEVSSDGRVRNCRTGRVLKPTGRRYLSVMLSVDANQRRIDVHRLVALAFHGEPPPGQVARHLNDVRTDNRMDNIAWGTPVENNMDAIRNGRNMMKNRTHCQKGHPYSEENTLLVGSGHKVCRTCNRERCKARYTRIKSRVDQ